MRENTRKKTIIGNWKMNLSLNEARELAFKIKSNITPNINVDIAISPPFVYLLTITNIFKDTKIQCAAQNMFYKMSGAYTGEISPRMLSELNVSMVIIGHSERRQFFRETNEDINLKIKTAFEYDLTPIFCVGEDLTTRENKKAEEYVKNQVLLGVKDLDEKSIEKLIIAYEPIWAIGTGKICRGEDANTLIKMIRNTIEEKTSKATSDKIRILYGGSIKSDNFSEHIKYPDIDGGLVGGSSLLFDEFLKIIYLANNVHAPLQNHFV